MTDALMATFEDVVDRLVAKRLFGTETDSLSLRVPGRNEALIRTGDGTVRRLFFDGERDGDEALHACVYRARLDVGGVLLGTTAWTRALAAVNCALPSLFDEQARHIGPSGPPLDDPKHLAEALESGGNAYLLEGRRLLLGSTPNRVVLNADLVEKCTKAFILAVSTGDSASPLPAWVCELWYARLHEDQKRAAASYRSGVVPEGMDAY
jgi:hypothetical protein